MHSRFCQLHNTVRLCLSQNKFPSTEFSLDLKDKIIFDAVMTINEHYRQENTNAYTYTGTHTHMQAHREILNCRHKQPDGCS